MTTQAQQKNKVENAQINTQAITPVTLTPNQGSVVPNVWQQNYVQDSIGDNPTITPPTEENIHKNMFIGSGMVGLMAALATGNPAAGLVAGMWGAVAIHDHGYDLRQRSKQVNKLQAEGYSFPAILNWYKTGDNKDLDKEYNQMEQDKRADKREALQDKQFNERMDQSDRRAQESESRFERSQAGMESRFERGLEAQEKRAELAASAAQSSGFKQQAMERRQSLMKAATLDADQYRAMTRSKAAAMKAAADIAQGTPISEQQLELMGQLIDAPNASVKLSQTHHISQGAAHGMLDRAKQYLNKNIAGGGDLTDQQANELMDVINAGHAAQEQSYYEQVGAQASQITDPQEMQNFAIATGLSEDQLQRAINTYNVAEQAAKAVPFASVGDKPKATTGAW